MEAINLLTGYADKLKAADRELKRLEKASKKLSEKQAATDEERERLEDSLTDHQRKTAALLSEKQDGELQYIKSVYEQDVSAQRDAQARRQEIDVELKHHAEAIEQLRTALEELPSYEEEASRLAGELEALNFGNGFLFGNNLRDALVRNEAALKSRQSEARSNLPAFSEATRRAVDPAYRERQEKAERWREESARITRAKIADNERKANRVTGLRRQ